MIGYSIIYQRQESCISTVEMHYIRPTNNHDNLNKIQQVPVHFHPIDCFLFACLTTMAKPVLLVLDVPTSTEGPLSTGRASGLFTKNVAS